MSDWRPALVWCPCPDIDAARKLSALLLDEGLAGCANILPAIESHFIWQGTREAAQEIAVLFKTRSDLLQAAVERLAAAHPYGQPAIVGWESDAAPQETLDWLGTIGTFP